MWYGCGTDTEWMWHGCGKSAVQSVTGSIVLRCGCGTDAVPMRHGCDTLQSERHWRGTDAVRTRCGCGTDAVEMRCGYATPEAAGPAGHWALLAKNPKRNEEHM